MFNVGDEVKMMGTGIYLPQNAIIKSIIYYEDSDELWGYLIHAEVNGEMEVPYEYIETR